jgi:hypothetical protein
LVDPVGVAPDRYSPRSTSGATHSSLREHTGWSDWQVRTHLNELVELELLHIRAGMFGKEYLYALGDESPALWSQPAFALTDVEALHNVLAPAP